jgi:hypothetical protein
MTNEDLNLSPHMAQLLERYAEHGQPRGLSLREFALEELASTLRQAGAAKASLEEAMKEAEQILAGLRHAMAGGDAAVLSEAGISPLDPADSE